ncbi:Aquaporin-9 [Caenorhabditis elegans]|nr:Aquaporin-9 [Caenorhabditis elegans]SPC48673.1 Aquaporin-9 [Caenorhabditis elegans]|eukprot:NP_001348812.1 AQuaPorin or aquaglyceroporin related [Caenorhabditis elegans]
MQRNSEGILIGYDNTLSRARGGEIAAPRTYTPSYQVFESSRTQITTADRRY